MIYIRVLLVAVFTVLALSIVFYLPPTSSVNVNDVPGTTPTGTTTTEAP